MPSKKRRKISPSGICPVAYQFYARCSGFRDFHETLPLFFLPLAFFPSAPVSPFFAISVVKYRGKYVALDLFAVEAASWCDHPVVRFWWLLLFLRFAEKHKIRTRSFRSTRLVSWNKSGGHATVRSWWLILFWRFAEKQNPRYIVISI